MMLSSLCAFTWLSWAPFCAPAEQAIVGYVEGEYVAIAPIDVARIESESVRRGDVLKPGEPVARLEAQDAGILLRNEVVLAETEGRAAQPIPAVSAKPSH